MQDRPSAFARVFGRPQTTLDTVALSLLVTALVVICACCSCVFLPGLLYPGRGTTTTTLQEQPTNTPAPTNTAAPPEKPTIGAPDSAFAAGLATRTGTLRSRG